MTLVHAVADGAVMTWAEYESLGEDVQVEYIDGRAVVSPAPTHRHQKVSIRSAVAIEQALPPTHDVVMAWAWKPGADEFIPDVMVHPVTTEQQRFTGVPALVIEVLSTNRRDDLLVKRAKYAAAGLSHYWVVDLRGVGSIEVLLLDGNDYRVVRTVHAGEDPRVLSIGIADVVIDPVILG